MKVSFIGFQGKRQHHQDWALEIIAETDFEKSFFSALFHSDRYRPGGTIKQMQPIATMLYSTESGVGVMLAAERLDESSLAKANQRIAELEEALINS